MRLNSNTPVPDNVTATVKSVSAVGEQYIDLVPPAGRHPRRDAAQRVDDRSGPHRVGQDIAGLLHQADQLVSSIDNTRLQDLLRETFNAFNGSGPELARLIQSSRLLVDEANANSGQTTQLIDQAGPFLEPRSAAATTSSRWPTAWPGSPANSTTPTRRCVRCCRPRPEPPTRSTPRSPASGRTSRCWRPTSPTSGRIGVIYHKSIEQALVIFPALLAALNTVAGGVPTDEGGKLDFKVDLGDPPTCNVGFIPATQIRSPADETLRDLPTDLYCKAAQNDPTVVRGARNYPVPGVPRQAGTHRSALP